MFTAKNGLLKHCRAAVTNVVPAHQYLRPPCPALKSPLGTSSPPATKPERHRSCNLAVLSDDSQPQGSAANHQYKLLSSISCAEPQLTCKTKKIKAALAILLPMLCLEVAHASNADLATAVKESIQQEFGKNAELRSVVIKDLTLIQESENKYRGLLEVSSPYGEEKLAVSVTTDDENLIWEIAD